MEKEKKYRPNVAAVVLSSAYPFECKILLAKRNDMEDVWQFPQGGIDEGESAKFALMRELKEEIGTDEIEILAEFPEWINYDFPTKVAQKMYPYDGQSQKYFLVRLKANAKVNLNTKEPEFNAYKFVSLDDVFNITNHFKKPIYLKVLKYFKEGGYL